VGDILNPATLHKYVYAADNPVNATDPTGRDIVEQSVWNMEVVEAVVREGGDLRG
jgi:hypothetical protein